MSDRSDLLDAKVVVERRERADHGLPEAVLNAYDAHEAARALPVTDAEDVEGARHPLDAAEEGADRLLAGEAVDVQAVAQEVRENKRRYEMAGEEWAVAHGIVEVTGQRLVSALRANAETIVVEFMRPAFALLLDEARSLAEKLRAAGFDPLAPPPPVWSTPPPDDIRDALRELDALAARRALIADARGRVLRVAAMRPEEDSNGLFLYCERPEALAPAGWEPPSPLPRPEPPTGGPLPVLVWLVRDVWPAQPWLPLPAEQDAARQALFAQRVEAGR